MLVTSYLDEYLLLMEKKPWLFEKSSVYPIITDIEKIREFESKTGLKIGVLYKSAFNMLVVDLIDGKNGPFAYERVIPVASERAVICVPVINNKLLLLEQFRHPTRTKQLCFPRGFGENGIPPIENAKKELFEETKAVARECIPLGSLTADSGLIGAHCDVFLCFADSYDESSREEGIVSTVLLGEEELFEKISRGEIDDGFTLSAYSLFKASKHKIQP